jgi:hypothetical protein
MRIIRAKLLFSMLGVLAIIYVVLMVPIKYFIQHPTGVIIKER